MHPGFRKRPIDTVMARGGLYISEGTVRNYLSSAIQKLETRNREQAIYAAKEKGWI